MKSDYGLKGKKTKICFAIGVFLIALACIPSVSSATTHPFLLFENINETPGYQHRTEAPWMNWEASIINAANLALSKDFTDPTLRMLYQGSYTSDLALAYQISKDATYAEKAEDALLNLDIGAAPYKFDKSEGLLYYSLAYDWIQPYLNTSNDTIIRNKLAALADEVYYDLNDGGASTHYVASADYHCRAYPAMGVVGCALEDYVNGSLNSTPADWQAVGGEYLWGANDTLHDWNESLMGYVSDVSGMYGFGSYKNYFYTQLSWVVQVYTHFFGNNTFDEYPLSRDFFVTDVWTSLPNRYDNNWVTTGNVKWYYHGGVMNLYSDDDKAYILNHNDIIEDSTILPYTRAFTANTRLLYLVYDDYSVIERKNPEWTSHLNSSSFFQVFRENWENESDWLSIVTLNKTYAGNRMMAHHDQLSFEYYSKGDLLLADCGEVKHVLAPAYGMREFGHNCILIEDPRTPFDELSVVSDNRARGIFKGKDDDLRTPAILTELVQNDFIEVLEAESNITSVVGNGEGPITIDEIALSTPINYKRAIIYPNKDYFIIVDRLEGTEPWTYRNLFRFSSLNITPSTGKTEPEAGHVNGNLTTGDTPYDWLLLSFNTEQTLGINTSSIKWNTTNPYGDDVELHLFSAPSSEIRVTKHVTRIAGYDLNSEALLPLVYFRTNESTNDLYRVTVLLSRYATEDEKIPEDVPVNGVGNAVKVISGTTTDFIYSGKGESSFADLSTDADTLYFRKLGQPSTFTFIKGTYMNYSGASLFEVSEKVDYVSLKNEGTNKTFVIKGDGTGVDITLYGMDPSRIYQVKRDGLIYTNWETTDGNTKMVITTDLSEHTFEIEAIGADGGKTSPTTTTVITPTPTEAGWNNVSQVVVTFFRSDDLGLAYTNYSKISAAGPWTTVNTATAIGPDAENVTDITEDNFNVTVSDEGVTTVWYYSVDNNATNETIKNVTAKIDTTPPSTISNLQNITGTTWINWTWINPENGDFSHTIIYLNGVFKRTTTDAYFNTTRLNPDTTHEIGTLTVDTNGNVNTTWVNQTTKTLAAPNSPPVAVPNGPYAGMEGVAVSFSSTGSSDPDGSIISFDWNFGDGNTATGPMPTHTYAQDGAYTVTLTVTDNEGATDTKTTTATIADTNPTAEFAASASTGPEPLTVTFSDASSSYDGITVWQWDFDNDGVIDSTVQNPVYIYTEEGTYIVTLTVSENDGDSDTETKVEYITVTHVNQPPLAVLEAPETGTEGVPLTANGNGSYDSDGSIVSYDWNFGDGNTGTGPTPTHTYAQDGSYTVTLTVTDNEGATNATTKTLTIRSTPADVKVTPETQNILAGAPVQVNITVEDVTNMGGYQVTVNFDPRAMSISQVTEGNILKSGGTTSGAGMEIIHNNEGSVTFFYTLTAYGASVSGSGTLATIYFDTNASADGTFNLRLSDVLVTTGTGESIPVNLFNGSVNLIPFTVTLTSPENMIYASTSVRLNLAVQPEGTVLDWLAYRLDNGTNVTISGNTAINGIGAGDHTLVVYARDNNDNMAMSNTVYFTVHPGDINGDTVVNIRDLQLSAWAFLSQPGDANWNGAVDLNCDDKINIFDYQLVAWNIGNTYL